MTRPAFWRAWSVWAVTMAITAAAIGYDARHPLPARLADTGGNGVDKVSGLTFIVAFATVGALLAWKKPGNPIGWLLSGSGLAYAVGGFSQLLIHFPRTRTLGNWLGWTWLLGLGLCVLVVLLFPAGSLPSRRWRPVAWAAGAGLAGWVLGNAFAPTITSADPHVPNPVGVTGAPGKIFAVMVGASLALIAATGLAAVLSLVFRYRKAQAAERAQLRWLVYAGALIVVAFFADTVAEQITGPGTTANNLQNAVSSGGAALIPVAIGVAVLRYRLYDIDRIISRTRGVRDRHRPAGRGVRRAGAAGHRGAPLPHPGGGGRRHAGRRGPVHPGAAAGAEPRGPAVQPRPVRRGPDRGGLRHPAERHGRPGLGPRRPDRHRVPRARADPRIGVDQPSSGPVLTRQPSEFRGGERGQLLGQAASLGRTAVGRPG